MSQQGQFDLCPKCGAIARDGMCQSCGYEIPGVKEALEKANDFQDVYQSQSSQDIYRTPDVSGETDSERSGETDKENLSAHTEVPVKQDGTVPKEELNISGGLFSGEQQPEASTAVNEPNNNGNPYAANGQYSNGNPYVANGQYSNGNPYAASGQYNNGNPYAANGQYNNGNPYAANGQYNNANSYPGNNQYYNNAYGNGYQPYPNPYSPYAAPQSKKYTGLIIGVIIGATLLFLIAFVALVFLAVHTYMETRTEYGSHYEEYSESSDESEDYEYDDYEHAINGYYEDDYYEDGYGYESGESTEDEYYSLQDDLRFDLSYSVAWEYYEYETDLDNVIISVNYPILSGENVPNLDTLNEKIAKEVQFFTEYFEEEYQPYLTEDGFFGVSAVGYVTYMSEEVLSVVFSETVHSDYFDSVSLYCINIDMENGVVLDNNDLLKVDDNFSVDFRVRSEEQNGTVEGLDRMSDQEITDYMSDSNLIVFYIPEGMEIGLNYDEGWVTVTYRDYEDYLNIF